MHLLRLARPVLKHLLKSLVVPKRCPPVTACQVASQAIQGPSSSGALHWLALAENLLQQGPQDEDCGEGSDLHPLL